MSHYFSFNILEILPFFYWPKLFTEYDLYLQIVSLILKLRFSINLLFVKEMSPNFSYKQQLKEEYTLVSHIISTKLLIKKILNNAPVN